jgi:predicted HTH transcriptional regulator
MQRYGLQRERTELHFDRIRRIATLGESDSEKNAKKQAFQVKDMQKSILEVVAGTPGITQSQLLKKVPAAPKTVLKELSSMKMSGLLHSEGKGTKGNPIMFYLAEVPTEKAAA